jgi:hypothetical protein
MKDSKNPRLASKRSTARVNLQFIILWLAFAINQDMHADQTTNKFHLPAIPQLPKFKPPTTNTVPLPPGLSGSQLPQRRVRISNTNGAGELPVLITVPIAAVYPGNGIISTNKPDFVAQVLSNSVTSYEQELAKTNLNPVVRKSFERLLEDRKRQLADHEKKSHLN